MCKLSFESVWASFSAHFLIYKSEFDIQKLWGPVTKSDTFLNIIIFMISVTNSSGLPDPYKQIVLIS